MIQVAEHIWRGPRPQDLTDLKAQGFKAIISLEEGWFELFHDDPYKRERPIDFGISLARVKCSDIFPPNEDQVADVLSLLNTPLKIYIHCLTGVDRTGFMCAVYRMQKQGWSFDQAYAEWVELGRHWWFDWWKIGLKTWENL